MEAAPSLNWAIPYMVRHTERMTTKPAAAKDPAGPAMSVLRRGPVLTKGPTRRNP
ncbi:hypothetical protein Mapa_009011 [Marchantia paleacea]|nr:hypothetical protein Mapa_009011 [Marchantia paleacea]